MLSTVSYNNNNKNNKKYILFKKIFYLTEKSSCRLDFRESWIKQTTSITKDQYFFLPLHSAFQSVCSILNLSTMLVTKYLSAVARIISLPNYNKQERKLLHPEAPVNALVPLTWSASCTSGHRWLCHVTRSRRCADWFKANQSKSLVQTFRDHSR